MVGTGKIAMKQLTAYPTLINKQQLEIQRFNNYYLTVHPDSLRYLTCKGIVNIDTYLTYYYPRKNPEDLDDKYFYREHYFDFNYENITETFLRYIKNYISNREYVQYILDYYGFYLFEYKSDIIQFDIQYISGIEIRLGLQGERIRSNTIGDTRLRLINSLYMKLYKINKQNNSIYMTIELEDNCLDYFEDINSRIFTKISFIENENVKSFEDVNLKSIFKNESFLAAMIDFYK